jgi:glycosyltransferase involved in cell wall biosynthesis
VVVTGAFRGCGPLLLFVGAFRPNKGHAKAVEVFADYLQRSGRPAHLHLVGSLDPRLSQYVNDIQDSACRLGVFDLVHIATSVNPSQLRAFYTLADLFLCVSAHEGFCVPLVEAMAFRVPIVAWNAAAVGETMGGIGTTVDDDDQAALAEAIDELMQDPLRAIASSDDGRQRYETVFHPQVIRRRLLGLVEEVTS